MMGRLATGTCSWPFRGFLALLLVLAWASTTKADSSSRIVRVEEDWELVVATPDPDSDGPQVACVISPVGDLDSVHAAFELNNQSLPSFVPGGLQLQIWSGEMPLSQRKFPNEAVMAQPGETVRWTQSMKLTDEGLVFEITNGSSSTWGTFGGQGYLKAAVATTLTDLNGYHPEVSVQNSGVSYAANRVESLVLRRVRAVTSTGEVLEDTSARTVCQSP
ncbi:MAG: hypothetical protein A2V98_12490 [Planctomycetes bacterium RBG_16_64_12]|nr:MAG: hypothetical protein A2V98_12490 [Planctomycetes bacterium RBG_16_64_12]